MEAKETIELLKAEYLHLQSTIEGGDGKALTIKAWSITFSFAAFGVAFANDSKIIFIIAACGSGIFWFLEALWKTFQIAHYERIYEIERYFRNEIKEIKVLQITDSWIVEFKKKGFYKLFNVMCWPHVCLPHIIVIIIGLLLFVLTNLPIFAK